jgi:hypothetical protein
MAAGRDLAANRFMVDLVGRNQRVRSDAISHDLGYDTAVDRGLHYLRARFPESEAFQVSAVGRKDYVTPDGIRVCQAVAFLKTLV